MIKVIELSSVSERALQRMDPFIKAWECSPLTGNAGRIEGPELSLEYEYDSQDKTLKLNVARVPARFTRGDFIGRIINLLNAAGNGSESDEADNAVGAGDETCTCEKTGQDGWTIWDKFCIQLKNDTSVTLTYGGTDNINGSVQKAIEKIPAKSTVDCAFIAESASSSTGGCSGKAYWNLPDGSTRLYLTYNGGWYGTHSCVPSLDGKNASLYTAVVTNEDKMTSGDPGCPRMTRPKVTFSVFTGER